MRILFVASLYYPHVGGIETVITELARCYAREGHEVCVLTKKYPLNLEERSFINGIWVYRVKSARTIEDFEEVARDLLTMESHIKADCVHLIGLRRPLGLFALLLARKWGVPLVVSAGGGELPELHDSASKEIWNESMEIAVNVSLQADRNVTFSHDLKLLLRKYVSDNLHVDVIHAGVDLERISGIDAICNDRPFIFSCRRLVWSKGTDLSIHAFARICKDFPLVNLIIAGDGDERENLVRLVDEYGISHRVRFIGTISWEQSIRWLKSALFTVVPSRSEGGGLINIEAQASGCPVVGSRAAGIAEYTKENETALLFDTGDIGAYTICMTKLISDRALRLSFGKRALEYAESFSWHRISGEYLAVYYELIGSNLRKPICLWSEESRVVWEVIKK